jgi:hypothetical protein
MARKRRPLVLGAEPVVLDAPGLHLFIRRGKVEQYWKASAEARRRAICRARCICTTTLRPWLVGRG